MQYRKETLRNGLRIILAPMEDTDTATILVMTGSGSRHESRAQNGIAHFLEHMFFKGTENRPEKMDIARELDAIGAEYNAFTSKEYTGYYAKTIARHFDIALDIVSDIFLHSKLEQKEIDIERGAILQEINMYEDMPMRRVGELFERQLYGDTPLGWDIAGTKDNVKRFRRNDFVRYMRNEYVAGNVVVGAAGKIDVECILKKIQELFPGLSSGERKSVRSISEKQKHPQTEVRFKKTDQTHFVTGVRTFNRYDRRKYALGVLATILGGGMSSRLFMEIREKRGLAYNVHTGTEAYGDAGYLATQCGVEHENLEKALKITLSEYRKMTKEKVPESELLKAKEYIKGKMAMGLEGSDSVAEYLVGQEIHYGEILLPEEKMRMIDEVSTEDIFSLAREIFIPSRLNCTVIGPHREMKRRRLEKILASSFVS